VNPLREGGETPKGRGPLVEEGNTNRQIEENGEEQKSLPPSKRGGGHRRPCPQRKVRVDFSVGKTLE